MIVRVPTEASLTYDRAAGVASLLALSAALVGPPEFAGLLTAIPVVAFAIATPLSIARQRKGDADIGLVSKRERQRFIVKDTALVLGMVACVGVVFFLIFTTHPAPLRAAVGLSALVLAALANEVRARSSMAHANRIMPPG